MSLLLFWTMPLRALQAAAATATASPAVTAAPRPGGGGTASLTPTRVVIGAVLFVIAVALITWRQRHSTPRR